MTVKRTRLCYWIARPPKPGVQSSNTSRVRFTVISHTPVRSRFYHIHIVYKRNWYGSCSMNLAQKKLLVVTYFSNSQFVPLRCWVLVKHAIKRTGHGNSVADGAVAKLLRLWRHVSGLWRHAVWIRIATSHNAWMGYVFITKIWIAEGRFINIIRPLETMGRVWYFVMTSTWQPCFLL